MKAWLTRIVAMADLEYALCDLERTHPSIGPPIITFVDQSRIIISWPYLEQPNAPSL